MRQHDPVRRPRTVAGWISALLLLFVAAPAALAASEIEDVERLLAQMTLEEKAGQMTQLTLEVFRAEPGDENAIHGVDPDKLRDAIVNVGVGSILNQMGVAFTGPEWYDIVGEIQRIATEESRLGIPILYGIDSVHGANYIREATIMPQNLTLAATWNPELARAGGLVTAIETRATGMNWNFAPDADAGRQPLWSRFFETFGEDPLLVSEMVVASIQGMESAGLSGDDALAACVKHFLGYSVPVSGHDRSPAIIAPWELAELHLPPFRAAVDSGVRTLMVNSGEINGVPVHANRDLLTGLLREELGFQGLVLTDWGDVIKLHDFHLIAETRREAALIAVEAGIDMSMTAMTTDFATDLVALVREGRLSESRLDESVRRILTLKHELGLFDRTMPDRGRLDMIGTDEHAEVSLAAARESAVLLRNRGGVLPVSSGGTRVLVTGPTADRLTPVYGAWSFTWQGDDESQYPDTPTVLDAMRTQFGDDHVVFSQGADLYGMTNFNEVARAAANADVIVVCLGEDASTEMLGNIGDLTLEDEQIELVRRLAATGKPLVGVMISNRPRTFAAVHDAFDAFIWLGQPGPYGPQALAEIIAGEVNPSGRLPFTYPRYPNALTTYDRKRSQNDGQIDPPDAWVPAFEFGAGMGYAPFSYDGLDVSVRSGEGDVVRVEVTVRNDGDRSGHEVVQLFVTDEHASVTPPAKRLRGFEKIALDAGESRRMTFSLSRDDLSFADAEGRMTFESGWFVVRVGGLTQRVRID